MLINPLARMMAERCATYPQTKPPIPQILQSINVARGIGGWPFSDAHTVAESLHSVWLSHQPRVEIVCDLFVVAGRIGGLRRVREGVSIDGVAEVVCVGQQL